MTSRFKDILVAASPGHLEPATFRAAVRLADTSDAHEIILRSVRCSVLALKPEGFVSPVRPEHNSVKAGR